PLGRKKPDDGTYKAGPEDTKFAVFFNGDAVEGPSAKDPTHPDKLIAPMGPGQWAVSGRIHDILNRHSGKLPAGDLCPVYFPVPTASGAACAGIPEWQAGSYAAG